MYPHVDRNGPWPYSFNACVARSVKGLELKNSPKAQAAMDEEFKRLVSKGTFDFESVEEWKVVSAKARRTKVKLHVGLVFGICVEKGSELPAGDANRKFKGRYVFQGNNV